MNTDPIQNKLLEAISILSEIKNLQLLHNGEEHFDNAIASKRHELYTKVRAVNDMMEDDLASYTGRATSPAEAIMSANRKLSAYLPGFSNQNLHTIADGTQGFYKEPNY